MPKVKVFDLLKEVEYNRKSLIKHCNENGINVSPNASLSTVTNMTCNLDSSEPVCHARFFDIDNTLLKDVWFKPGSNLIPPPNPTYDSERLEFNRWCSAIGNNFTNVQHDIDYAPLYTIKDRATHVFVTLTEETGLFIDPYLNVASNVGVSATYPVTVTIDWGDGSIDSDTFTSSGSIPFTHTYIDYGSYEIKIYEECSRTPANNKKGFLASHAFSGSTKYYFLGTPELDKTITKIYSPYSQSASMYYDMTNLDVLVLESSRPNNYNLNASCPVYVPLLLLVDDITERLLSSRTQNVIIDKGCTGEFWVSPLRAEQLIIPSSILPTFNNGASFNSTQSSAAVIVDRITFIGCTIQLWGNSYINVKKVNIVEPIKFNSERGLQNTLTLAYCTELNWPETLPFTKILSLPHLKYFKANDTQVLNKTTLSTCPGLEYLEINSDFNVDLDIHESHWLTIDCLLQILNKIKDNSGSDTIKNIVLPYTTYLKASYTKVSNTNSIWCIDSNGITILEAITNKNWTVSTY